MKIVILGLIIFFVMLILVMYEKIPKWVIGIGIIAIIGGLFTVFSLEKVDQGEVGVVWTMKSGVKKETLNPGYHFVSPLAKVKCYPISQQQIVFSNNASDYNEKKHDDWSIDAPANGGMVTINLTVNYKFQKEKVTELYEKFNGMDGDQIMENRIQNSIIAYVKEVTPQYSVMDIYSDKRSEVSKSITEYLNTKLSDEYGIEIPNALIIDVKLDKKLKKKIQAKEEAKQDAEKAELDKQTAKAQGEADKVKAEADAAVKKIEAESAAEQKEISAEAEAKANKKIASSITDELIRMKEAEARYKHGWVTVQGADSVVTEK